LRQRHGISFKFQISGGILFPKLDRDRQRKQICNFVISSLAIVFCCGIVVVVFLLLDKR